LYTTVELVRGSSKLADEKAMSAADVEMYIKKAQARIDAKLKKRYRVPLIDPVPDIVESIATDFAAGFAIEKYYSQRPGKEEPYLAEVLIKRAEADLAEVLEEHLLDGLPGVEFLPPPNPAPAALARPAMQSTTPVRSEMTAALERW